ncbi:unnamed protein product [Orchesella dallaii]|uniref:Gustatory receptor n=1 Tax=Orchesella dallaii TaxID=48710 RepID=A0ABP1RMD7_9HEXA
MLSSTKLKALRSVKYIYWFWYEFPIGFDLQSLKIYVQSPTKWIPWYIGIADISLVLVTNLYILTTFFLLGWKREGFRAFQIIVVAVGCYVHLSAVLVGRSMLGKDIKLNLDIVTKYLQLEFKVLSRYQKALLDPKRKDFLDAIFWSFQLLHVSSFGVIAFCIYAKVDTTYWLFEDIFGKNHQHRFSSEVSEILFLIRVLILFVTVVENARMMVPFGLLIAETLSRISKLVTVLSFKVTNSRDFFKYYIQLTVLCNFAEKISNQIFFVTLAFLYCIFIQCACLCIRGYGRLDMLVYGLFVDFLVISCVALFIGLRLFAELGEKLVSLPRIKKNEMGLKHVKQCSFSSKFDKKRSAALMPIAFSFGRFYPMGANFSRNLVGNLIEDLMASILVIEKVLS